LIDTPNFGRAEIAESEPFELSCVEMGYSTPEVYLQEVLLTEASQAFIEEVERLLLVEKHGYELQVCFIYITISFANSEFMMAY